jgi:TPR repeat protein
MMLLGRMLATGYGCKANSKEAERWIKAASRALGVPVSLESLKDVVADDQ